jgi:hypothetical protein
MAEPHPILVPGSERAHYAAQLTLCLLAGLCGAALGWAAWQGAFSGGNVGLKPLPGPTASIATSANTSAPGLISPPAVSKSTPAPVLTPASPAAGSSPASKSLGREISNAQAREMVEVAREVRKLGDMAPVLESLRAADLREPNHPEILSEMALTYETMGLTEKAETMWRSVIALGESNGGGYYTLAKAKLLGREIAAKTPERNEVSMGACQIIPDKTVTKGQRLALRVPIKAAPGVEIDPTQMDIHVYFFDRVGADRIESTRADPPVPSWVSAPVDWKEGEELVDFSYNMPELKPEELRELGKRSYYGYVVKIYYLDRLMDVQAEPQALVNYNPPGAGPAGADSALFPKN